MTPKSGPLPAVTAAPAGPPMNTAPPLDCPVEAFGSQRISAGNASEVRPAPGGHGSRDALDHECCAHQLLAGTMAASLARRLVLQLDRCSAGPLQLTVRGLHQ